MKYRCTSCWRVVDLPNSTGWPVTCFCGASSWVSPSERSGTMMATGGYVPTEADALRAEVAALKAELTELRALRDRLVKPLVRDGLENYGRIADTSGEDDMGFESELFHIIKRAQELAG